MLPVPRRVPVLDSTLGTVRHLGLVTGAARAESDYDQIIVNEAAVLGEALESAEVIAAGHRLVVLDRQVLNIDVLAAELDAHDRLHRLVIIETKLIRNPEAKRAVLGQVLDYAHVLQNEMTAEKLIGRVPSSRRPMLEESREELENCLRHGDFLLLICGDQVDANLMRIIDSYLRRKSGPLAQHEIAVMALLLFEDTTTQQFVLVPTVLGAVMRGERDVTIRVEITKATPETEATVAVAPKPAKTTRWSAESLFTNAAEHQLSAEAVAGLRVALDIALTAGPGSSIDWPAGTTYAGFIVRAGAGNLFAPTTWAGGSIQIFTRLLRKALGDDKAAAIVARLNSTLGVSIDIAKSYPTFKAALLSEPGRATAFRTWVAGCRQELVG